MPVVGHAFAGLALAALSRDARRHSAHRNGWTLPLVLISYAPDIAALTAATLGLRTDLATAASHSLAFAVVCAGVLTPVLTRMARAAPARAFGFALAALVLHDVMDVLQSPGRMPFWPIRWPVDIGTWIPTSLAGELLVSLPLLLVAGAFAIRTRPVRPRRARDWVSVGAVTAIVVAAAGVSELRDQRERDLVRARELAESGDHRAALALCDSAERWPSPAKPGRLEYIRAMAWWGLGDRARAEEAYLRSYAADGTYIWTVADLAAFYASEDAPLDERRRRAAPWVRLLQTRFSNHPALPQLLARVERRLGADP